MNIAMILTSHDELGTTGKKTGFWLEEFAAPYYVFKEAGVDLTLASMVFVARPPQATPTGRYLGCVHTQRLLREPPFELVAGALDAEMSRLRPDASLADVTRFFASYNLVCAPVVDDEEHLLGAVTVDDVLDHLLPDNWRDDGLDEDEPAPAARGVGNG